MGKILVLFILAFIFIRMFKQPWVAAVFYLIFGVMQPQYIWPWHFEGLSTSMILALLAIAAWGLAALNQKVDFEIYKKPQNFVLLCMWGMIHLSDLVSPFPVYDTGVPAAVVLDTLNTIMIIYFVTIGILVSESALKYLSIGMACLTVYYVYWSNDQYFSSNWFQFNQGRLMGPARSIYKDENVFSTIFMVGMPFILYGIFYVKNNILKYSIFLVIPLLWHSLFLAGSRGAMIATVLSTFIASRLSKSKVFNKVLVVGFVAALVTQGGAMLSRSSETVAASQDSSIEEPLNPRIVSWLHGLSHIKNHPITGVGVQRFQHATRVYFPESIPHVAHNTFLQLSANSGLLVGLLYLYLFWLAFKSYKFCVNNGVEKYPVIEYVNKATITSLAGFFISAIFLDLMIFEAFYYLLIMIVVKQRLFEKILAGEHTSEKESKAPKKRFRNSL